MNTQKGTEEMPMIFVVGNSRSGTTMMGRILNLSKEIFTFHEIHFFEQLWSVEDKAKSISREKSQLLLAKLLKIQRKGYLNPEKEDLFLEEAKWVLDNFAAPSLVAEGIFALFLRYETTRHNKVIPCDQTPRNILYASEIFRMYPKAKIINLIRDPRDILLSQKNKWKRKFLGATQIPFKESVRSWINYHPITISKLWELNVSNALRYSDHPRFLTVRFEDLLKEQGQQVKKICQFIGIEFNADMLTVPQVGSSAARDDTDRKGIDPSKSESWRKGGLSSTEIYFSQVITGDTMKMFNYKVEKIRPDPVSVAYHLVVFPAKILAAFAMNLHRMKNITEALKRRISL